MLEGLDFAGHELARASLDACVKCTICETRCPVMEVTPLFSGPKFVGPQAERFRGDLSVDHSVDYCSSCGTCTLVCPQGVKVAELNNQARAVMKADNMPLRDRLITNTTAMGQLMTPFAPIANWALDNSLIRMAVEKTVGVHREAPMPKAQKRSLKSALARRKPAPGPFPRGPLVFFTGCAGQWFEVAASLAAIEVLEHLGWQVFVPPQGCCGLAKQSNGLYEGATKDVKALAKALMRAVRQAEVKQREVGVGSVAGGRKGRGPDFDHVSIPVVSTAGSCTGMVKHEARDIMGVIDPELEKLSGQMYEFSEFIVNEILRNNAAGLPVEPAELPEGFSPSPLGGLRRVEMKLPYHQPCQVKGQFMGSPAMEVMGLIPGLEVIESGRPCCGIAGTYGVKAEKYEVAQAVGKPLFEFVMETNPALAACETETCRWQIRKGTGATVVHPAQILHYALGLSPQLPTF